MSSYPSAVSVRLCSSAFAHATRRAGNLSEVHRGTENSKPPVEPPTYKSYSWQTDRANVCNATWHIARKRAGDSIGNVFLVVQWYWFYQCLTTDLPRYCRLTGKRQGKDGFQFTLLLLSDSFNGIQTGLRFFLSHWGRKLEHSFSIIFFNWEPFFIFFLIFKF